MSEVKDVISRCGLCKETFTRWTDRNNHLSAHFREGRLMKDWKGCRGLDPAVALAMENAMPPYLIRAESTGINPFSASTRCPNPRNDIHHSPKSEPSSGQRDIQPTPFEQLTQHLSSFVRERQAIGIPVTDDSIQHEARCFVYGDEDPWNQTAADNADWLQLFKDGMGLGPSLPTTSNDPATASPKPSFPLPWTTRKTGNSEPQSPPESCVHAVPSVDLWMPWAWQSPECLAEFRRSQDPHNTII